ncbi:hypothetical protein RFI_32515 [Reticulomyxa filosa]|uniref:Uncharacterized protein n=1 Tax=Reticulomyxa filosa TaxID=46433 RepID=X6LW22_RETFI|nr:hypothetical protein RFI_32515 [Reticulomyxa filosa]|eukprot:ETO04880.1 hypothetical protein RFI_32515 [Reticulomyxa filosa]
MPSVALVLTSLVITLSTKKKRKNFYVVFKTFPFYLFKTKLQYCADYGKVCIKTYNSCFPNVINKNTYVKIILYSEDCEQKYNKVEKKKENKDLKLKYDQQKWNVKLNRELEVMTENAVLCIRVRRKQAIANTLGRQSLRECGDKGLKNDVSATTLSTREEKTATVSSTAPLNGNQPITTTATVPQLRQRNKEKHENIAAKNKKGRPHRSNGNGLTLYRMSNCRKLKSALCICHFACEYDCHLCLSAIVDELCGKQYLACVL